MKSNLLLILLALFILSCTKKEDSTPTSSGTPLIKTITSDSIVVAKYWYDNEGRMTCSVTNRSPGFDSTVYTYGTASFEKGMYYGNMLMQTEFGLLENGCLVSLKGNKPDSSSFWSVYYSYDENGFLICEIHMDNDSIETWRVEYQIADGNIISMTRSNYIPLVSTSEYYPGTTNSLGVFVQGQFVGKYSKNLVKKTIMTYSVGISGEESFEYEYYDNGWVKNMTITFASETFILHFTYW